VLAACMYHACPSIRELTASSGTGLRRLLAGPTFRGSALALLDGPHTAIGGDRFGQCLVEACDPVDTAFGGFVGVPVLEAGTGYVVDAGFAPECDHDVNVADQLWVN
jgi:hypothetical protein